MDALKEADILATAVSAGEVRVNLGRGDSGKGIASDVAMWGPCGYLAVPNSPDEDGFAQAIYLQEGDRLRVLATRDNRFAELAGSLQPGDIAVVTGGTSRVILKREQDSATLYAENAQDGGKSMMVHVGGQSGEILAVNGGAKVTMKTDRIEMAVNGGGSIIIDKQGVHVFGPAFNADVGAGTLGLIGGVRPVPGTGSALYGPQGQVGVASTTWTIAP